MDDIYIYIYIPGFFVGKLFCLSKGSVEYDDVTKSSVFFQ